MSRELLLRCCTRTRDRPNVCLFYTAMACMFHRHSVACGRVLAIPGERDGDQLCAIQFGEPARSTASCCGMACAVAITFSEGKRKSVGEGGDGGGGGATA